MSDYMYGIQQQQKLYPILKEFFKTDLKETVNKYDKYDFDDPTASYELKSRKFNYSTYSTTVIAQDKIDPEYHKKQIYLFNFLDGTYYIEYNKELFSEFEVKEFRRYRQGINDVSKPYVHIPIDKLIKID
jgi:hypothetical protein